jgi:signal transduction histidine kinase
MTEFRSPQTLTALNDAALAIAEGISLPRTLQRIADTARILIQSQYAALGVLGDDGPRLKQFITSGMEAQIAGGIHHEPIGAGLLGEVFIESQPVNVPNIAEDPRSAGFCDNHPPMTSFLGAPITNRGKHMGNLYLCDRLDGQPFDSDDEELLRLLAAHAAIAIENAKLHEELQVAALRSERDRIGMELHDGVIQSIYAVGMKIDILRANLSISQKDEPQFQTVLEDLNHIIEDIRAYIRNLAHARDEQVALKSRIENLGTHFQDFSGVKMVIDVSDRLPAFSEFQRHNLLQIIREALSNIGRHANANRATVRVRSGEREVVIEITDNGQGFEVQDLDVMAAMHLGLRNLKRRAQQLEGTLDIQSSPGQGTTVTIRVPRKFEF